MKHAIRAIIAIGLLALAFDGVMLVLIQYECRRPIRRLQAAEVSAKSMQVFRSEQVLVSPNGRFEIRLVCTDDGCHLVQVDTVKDRMSVMEVTAEDGAIIGIGEGKYIKNGAYRAAMKEWAGFVEWGRSAEVVP